MVAGGSQVDGRQVHMEGFVSAQPRGSKVCTLLIEYSNICSLLKY